MNTVGPDRAKSMDSHDLLLTIMGGGDVTASISVTPLKALKVPEVSACINVLAQSISLLPFAVYQNTENGKEKDRKSTIYKVLGQKPNTYQSPIEFFRQMTFNCAWLGNAYARKIILGGKLIGLVPIENSRVKVKLTDSGDVVYEVNTGTQRSRKVETLSSDEIFHLRGPMCPKGWVSESPVEYAKETIATMIAIGNFSTKYFNGGAKAKAAFSLPSQEMLSDEAFERLRTSIDAAMAGDKPLVLEGGMEVSKLDYSARESLLADITALTVNKLCRIWRIQPHLIQELAKATYSNIEHQSREFVDHTLMPWIRLWESSIKMQLMDPYNDDVYPKLSAQALLRGDNKTRSEFYAKAVGGPWMTANQARALEEMPPVAGGEKLLTPMNMDDADQDQEKE